MTHTKRKNTSPPDLEAMPLAEAEAYVQEHYHDYVRRCYSIWKQSGGMLDFDDLRENALRDCPGMSMLWCVPFSAVFHASDGYITVKVAGDGNHPLSSVSAHKPHKKPT